MDKPKYAASGPSCFLGGTPLEKPYRHVLPQRVWFLHSLGLKKGINLAHFGLESGMAFEGTSEVYERIAGFQCHAIQNRSK